MIYLQNEKNLKAKTILGYRNSLTLPFKLAFNIILNDEHFKLLTRAQFLTAPSEKQIVPQWSLNHVLEQLTLPKFKVETATDYNLFLKTLFLTALASGNRASELAAISRKNISLLPEQVILPVRERFLFKNQTAERTPPHISFPSLGGPH